MATLMISWGFQITAAFVILETFLLFEKHKTRPGNDTLPTETTAKANLCNRQFQSVFTK